MGGRWSLLETTRRWRDSVHARCRRVALEFSAVALSSSGAESHLRREVVRSASHLGIDREEVVQAQIACTAALHPVV
jgi:hypothetical protein